MNEMQEILVDPFLLCLPNPCRTGDELEDFLKSLLEWSDLIRQPGVYVLLSEEIHIALFDDDSYPHRHRLVQLLKLHGCEIADERTVFKLTTALLDQALSLEKYSGIRSVRLDDQSINIEPVFIIERLKSNCAKAFAETLAVIPVVRSVLPERITDSILIASRRDDEAGEAEPNEIVFKLEVCKFDSDEIDIDHYPKLPCRFADSIPVLFSFELDLWDTWNGASTDESIESAIKRCMQNLVSTGTPETDAKSFVLGGCFRDSVKKWGAAERRDYAMVIIESCARIALNVPKNAIKEFRVNANMTSDQRSRKDGSLAYRTHLTKKGVGLRLMFWRRPDGTVEFANIGSKDELEIR